MNPQMNSPYGQPLQQPQHPPSVGNQQWPPNVKVSNNIIKKITH